MASFRPSEGQGLCDGAPLRDFGREGNADVRTKAAGCGAADVCSYLTPRNYFVPFEALTIIVKYIYYGLLNKKAGVAFMS
ncbi:hypothetical protein RNI52_00775 [Labrys neptuniae]|uniref:hypothetical protein n=1 Tax=Labrys neptuniae TaxID=376174 RepID=UPI00288E0566|nr:hypothetical protein [Labrys neptuniae]MDT3375845.1 hypothetical protein [Labrys neptuniae]